MSAVLNHILTCEELERARLAAVASATQSITEIYGSTPGNDIGHRKNVPWFASRMLRHFTKEKTDVPASEVFAYIAQILIGMADQTHSDYDMRRSMEYNTAATHVLKALDLEKQFIEYRRSLKTQDSPAHDRSA